MAGLAGKRTPALIALAVTTLAWAGIYIVGAVLVDSIDPISLTLLRWAPAAVVLLILGQLIERPDWRRVARHWWKLLLLGALGMIGFSTLLLEGLRHTTPVSGSLIGSAGPVLIAVLSALVLRSRLGWRMIAGLAISIVGVALVVTKGSLETILSVGVNLGDLLIVLATLCWAVYTVLGRILGGIPVITSTAVQALFATILLAIVVSFTGLQLPQDAASWVGAAYISLVGSALGFFLWNWSLRTVAPPVAGLTMNLIPLWTVLLAVALGETLHLWEAIGGLVIVAGVLLGTLPARRRVT